MQYKKVSVNTFSMIEQPNNDDSDSFHFDSWIILTVLRIRNLFRILDPGPGVKKAPDPRAGSATLHFSKTVKFGRTPCFKVDRQQKETEFTTLLEVLRRLLDRT